MVNFLCCIQISWTLSSVHSSSPVIVFLLSCVYTRAEVAFKNGNSCFQAASTTLTSLLVSIVLSEGLLWSKSCKNPPQNSVLQTVYFWELLLKKNRKISLQEMSKVPISPSWVVISQLLPSNWFRLVMPAVFGARLLRPFTSLLCKHRQCSGAPQETSYWADSSEVMGPLAAQLPQPLS